MEEGRSKSPNGKGLREEGRNEQQVARGEGDRRRSRLKEGRSGKTLLRIRITAEVDGVRSEFEITCGRYGRDNAALGRTYARTDAPGGREADAERLSALIKALTGREPKVYRMKDGKIKIECYEGHLGGFMRYTELADVVAGWLEETGRRLAL